MRTVCVYHPVDLDGWMSAAIVKHWFKSNNTRYFIKNLNTTATEGTLSVGNQELYFLGFNYGDLIPDLSEYDRVIMCDISFPAEDMWQIQHKVGYENFAWIDHHISAMNDTNNYYRSNALGHIGGLRDTKFAACELTWKYFFPEEPMPEIVRLLGRYDCFGHKGTDEEQKVLEFQYGARQCISNYEEAYSYLVTNIKDSRMWIVIYQAGQDIYKYLCTEAKQVYKNGFAIEYNQTHCHPYDGLKKFICINKERFNPINFGIDYHKDGYDGAACFWYNGKQWAFSLYNDNGEVDCSVIVKSFGGGGHKGAAGFRLNNEQFLKFISK